MSGVRHQCAQIPRSGGAEVRGERVSRLRRGECGVNEGDGGRGERLDERCGEGKERGQRGVEPVRVHECGRRGSLAQCAARTTACTGNNDCSRVCDEDEEARIGTVKAGGRCESGSDVGRCDGATASGKTSVNCGRARSLGSWSAADGSGADSYRREEERWWDEDEEWWWGWDAGCPLGFKSSQLCAVVTERLRIHFACGRDVDPPIRNKILRGNSENSSESFSQILPL
ncbi:hypothetical protein C8R43DRAFT_1107175 [Mycena crocata]|nr:hypothetical protein C8R43DRAFT_1107175 [Mycena crocata]